MLCYTADWYPHHSTEILIVRRQAIIRTDAGFSLIEPLKFEPKYKKNFIWENKFENVACKMAAIDLTSIC